MGFLIALDGVDASGKQTQTERLGEHLRKDGYHVRMLSFPAYHQESSALVKMYLNGDFGTNANDVNAYAASTFFAADRFATFRMDWKKDYEKDTIILADRYVSSNMIHQAGKIENADEKMHFLKWIENLEYQIYQLPKPDLMIFLNMPVQYGERLMAERENKFTGKAKKDIHEANHKYLVKSYENALQIAKQYHWKQVQCVQAEQIRSVEEIHTEIYEMVLKALQGRKGEIK